jgi:hypothetical protein
MTEASDITDNEIWAVKSPLLKCNDSMREIFSRAYYNPLYVITMHLREQR